MDVDSGKEKVSSRKSRIWPIPGDSGDEFHLIAIARNSSSLARLDLNPSSQRRSSVSKGKNIIGNVSERYRHWPNRTSRGGSWCWVTLCLCLVESIGLAHANPNESILVEQLNRGYHVQLQFEVNASPECVREVLTDYDQLSAINSKIVASQAFEHPAANVTRVRYEIRHCIWFYCFDIVIVEDVTTLKDGSIIANVIPDESDFKNGHTVWSLATSPRGTLIGYESSMEPGFWVFPILGPMIIKNTLREQITLSADRIQSLVEEKNQYCL